MFRIRQKSFIGLLFGCLLIYVMGWISFKFDLTPKQTFLYGFISLILISIILSLSNEYLIDFLFDEERKKKRFRSELKNLSNPEDKKKLIKKWSGKINLSLNELRDLIRNNDIDDDDFWISFFLHQTKEISRYQLDYFYGYLYQLKSKESINKLKSILTSRGILVFEDKDLESRIEISVRLSRRR